MFFIRIIFFILLLIPATSVNAQEKTALFITIDGLRPDAITKSSSPALFELLKESSYSLNASTTYPSKTMPSHTSLITGLDAKNHNNTQNNQKIIEQLIKMNKTFPMDTVFTLGAEENKYSTFLCGKTKLLYLIKPNPKHLIKCYNIYQDREQILKRITETFTESLKSHQNPINFIHYPEPDRSGHENGWMSDKYLKALKKVDAEINKLIGAIKEKMKGKDYLIIITADHGGTEKTHGTRLKEHMTIPWIATGNTVKPNNMLKENVFIYDTAPTILYYLGIPIPDHLDGRVVKEIFN